ncbi:MAG TPA: M28 family peptidase [Thermoanaerobaculia bacterium]|nr:M28 family peptidase [Thermoanaerobaculia bacterium]
MRSQGSRSPSHPASPVRSLTGAACLALLAAGSHAAPLGAQMELLPAGAEKAARSITADSLRAPIRYLADDLLGGRGPATEGDRLTQLYLSTQLESLGLQPAFDGGWLQPFDVVGIEAKVPKTWTFQAGGETLALKTWDELIAGSGVQRDSATIDSAEVVFVGYGIQAPEYDWDDFEGADLRGKVLLMLNNDPDWDPELFGGETRLYYGRWTYKYESAARQGASGAIIIHTTPSAGYPWQVVQTSWTGEQFQLPAEGEPRIEVAAWATEEATRKLLGAAGFDLDDLTERAKHRDFRPVPLGITTSITLENTIGKKTTANVGGVLPGSDPELGRETVLFIAHHDHLGTAEEGDDRVYNGAVDNASGTAQVLAIAGAYARLPEAPKRSTLFLFVAVEESGLLGSKYYARHPSTPPGRIAAAINYDGGNIWGKAKDVTLVGHGKSSLDAVAEAVAASQGRVVKPDQFADKGYYYRSDQFSLAKIGVPALYFDTGTEFVGRPEEWGKEQLEAWTERDYHQPSDELEDWWSFEGMVEDAVLGFYCGLILAEAAEMPAWVPGDEFEAARSEALAAVAAGGGGESGE